MILLRIHLYQHQALSLDNVLEILLSKQHEPSYSQRVIACAYLLGREDILVNISNQIREKFIHWLNEDDFKKQNYLNFIKVSDYLINELMHGTT